MATRGTGFINAQTYAALNQQGGRSMASALDSFVGDQQARAEEGLAGLEEDFEGQRTAGTLRFDGGVGTSAEARQRSASGYTGPDSLQQMNGFGGVQRFAQQAQESGALGADYYGRQALLSDKYGKQGGYTPGMSRFDSFLAGANGGQGVFEARRQSTSGLGQRLTNATQASQQQAQQARSASATAAGQYAQRADVLESQERNATQAAQRQRMRENQQEQADFRDQRDDETYLGDKRRGRRGGSALDSWALP